MTKKVAPAELARKILAEVECGKREVVSPGNLQSVKITQQEAIDLGLNPPAENRWYPHTYLSGLEKIAKG